MEVGSLSFKRLMKDVRSIMKQPLHEHGIYYSHNEDNILKGYALIIGPEDTPYAYGYYLFQMESLSTKKNQSFFLKKTLTSRPSFLNSTR